MLTSFLSLCTVSGFLFLFGYFYFARSLWQQAGRSGRREKPSLAVYVAFDGPLDQYFMKYPEKLFRGPIECCHIDARNPQVSFVYIRYIF